MTKSRQEVKVGIFVFAGLVLLALMLIQLSKGLAVFRETYIVRMRASDVGGLKERAAVLMSGVMVGTVSKIDLEPDGKSVTILLKIYKKFVLYADAQFAIESSGVLGDQYVAIKPTRNLGDPLQNNAEVICAEPLNLQEVARSAAGFIRRVDETAQRLNDAIADIRRLVLNEQTLTNLAVAAIKLRAASESAVVTVDGINTLFVTNAGPVTDAISNIGLFSRQLNLFGDSLNGVLETNQQRIALAVQDVETSAALLKKILEDAHAGKGLAGTLLHDEKIAAKVDDIVNNLAITTSNLNRVGLWRVFFPKTQRASTPPPAGQTTQSPKASGK